MAHVYDMDCELGCRLLRAEKDKLEALKDHIEALKKIDFYDPPFADEWDKWWAEYKEILERRPFGST